MNKYQVSYERSNREGVEMVIQADGVSIGEGFVCLTRGKGQETLVLAIPVALNPVVELVEE